MPNWCNNRVYIEASSEEIAGICDIIKQGKELLNYLCPEPEHDKEQKNHMPNWWHWRIAYWGTKWDVEADIISFDISGGWISLAFDSAWSPPIEALHNWADKSEDRSFNIRYIEWGMAYCGEADSKGLEEDFYIPNTFDSVKDAIPIDLDEEFAISEIVGKGENEQLVTA